MFGSFILLLPGLLMVLPTSYGKPVPMDVKRQIRIASSRIQTESQRYTKSPQVILDPLPDVVPGSKPIQGLWSIINDLAGFQLILDSELWANHSVFKMNIKSDFSTLQEHLKMRRKSMQCPDRTPNSFKDLKDYLKDNQKFSLSLVPKLLQRFNEYMNLCLGANIETC